MTKRRNSSQKKEQEKMTTRDLINTNINKMSDLEFRTTIIKVLLGVEKSTEDTRESCSAEVKEIKSSQVKIKNAILNRCHNGMNG